MIWYEVGLILTLGIIAYIHSRLILHDNTIVHWLWTAIYFGIVGLAFWFTKSWLLVGVSFLIREVFFAQVLNLIRKKKFFYISPTSGSVLDAIQGKAYKYVWFGSLAALIFTQFILLKKPKDE